MCVYMCVHMVHRPDVDIGCLTQLFCALLFQAGSLSPELTYLLKLAGGRAPEICPAPTSSMRVTDVLHVTVSILHACWLPHVGPHDYAAGTLTTAEPLPASVSHFPFILRPENFQSLWCVICFGQDLDKHFSSQTCHSYFKDLGIFLKALFDSRKTRMEHKDY